MSDEITWKPIGGLWIPQQEGDEISGKILGFQEDVGEYKSKGYLIETSKDVRTVTGGAVLDNHMKIFNLGNYVKIVFKGTKESKEKGKKGYKDFDIFIGHKG